MTDKPLSVAFLWHMHQPFYKDPVDMHYRLPWVRLHSTKDYLDMLEILAEFPAIRQTFNLTPSLIEQIIDYTENAATDRFLELTRKRPEELDSSEKIFLLEHFFFAHWDNMIKPLPRYFELLSKRGSFFTKSELLQTSKYFNHNDFRDLQVLFNLAWIDPVYRDRDEFLSSLVNKSRNYSEDDKALLIEKQIEMMKKIVPAYRKMSENGQIEISASPFYHPILPLLCNSDVARIAMPDVQLPRRFSHPEDARHQIRMSLDYFENIFGRRPIGMWPSEGSVSEEVCRIAAKEGLQWLATDEDVLARSLDTSLRDGARNVTKPDVLYRAYQFENVSLLFRDHILSDLIGFVYAQWDPKQAARDLLNKLLHIRETVPQGEAYLVSIILDGENAWEYYRNDGHDFLQHLYEGLSQEERLQTVSISEFLSAYSSKPTLKNLYPGSWINANFGIWIGHEEDNQAWKYLSDARDMLITEQNKNAHKDYSEAWDSIYIAEGSDWNWWYGDDHATDTQSDFDELFRLNLQHVYKVAGKESPYQLSMPILKKDPFVKQSITIRGFITPSIDGLITSYYEWYQGAHMDLKKQGGSMHKSESLLKDLYYGFDGDNLYIRLDPDRTVSVVRFVETYDLVITFLSPKSMKVCISLGTPAKAEVLNQENESWHLTKKTAKTAFKNIIECAISFHDLEASENEEILFFISIHRNKEEIERHPPRGFISLNVPSQHFESMMWD